MARNKSIGKDIDLRVRWLYVIFLVLAVAIVFRIAWIQWGPEGDELREKAQEITFDRFVIPASRGDILARDGRILSTTIPEYELFMDFKTLAQQIEKRDSFDKVAPMLADSLARFFRDRSSGEYLTMLERHYDSADKSRYVRLNRRKLSYTEEKRMAGFPIFSAGRFKSGYIAEQKSRRFMPMDSLARVVIGTVQHDTLIRGGVEQMYDSLLRGTDGMTMKQKVSGDFWIPVPHDVNSDPVDGYDIVTTINADIQDVAETTLRRQLIESDAFWGLVILMEVETGEIHTMCNLQRTGKGKYGEVYNNAIRTRVEPGSTFKLATLLTLLQDGGMTIADRVDCRPDHGLIAKVGIKDVRDDHHCSVLSLRETFEQSSNIGFARSVYNRYKENPRRYVDFIADNLAMGAPTGIDLPLERAPRIKDPADRSRGGWDGTTLQMMSYGYALEVTPLQVLTLYNAVANNGRMMRPMLVKQVRSYGDTVAVFEPQAIREQIAPLSAIRDAQACLAGVVDAGTGRIMKSAPYKAAAKTGTAQQVVPETGTYRAPGGGLHILASFTGYFPLENPKYSCMVAIKVHEHGGKRFYGASLAGPVFRAIADRVYAQTISLHDKDYGYERHTAAENEIKGGVGEQVRVATAGMGLSHSVNGDWWTPAPIEVQLPDRGNVLATGSVTEYSPEDAEDGYLAATLTGVVPQVTGMGLRDALFRLENAGLKVEFSGAGTVFEQSPAPGESVPEGTLVRLKLRNPPRPKPVAAK